MFACCLAMPSEWSSGNSIQSDAALVLCSPCCCLLRNQIDCFEIMYRCAKNFNEKVYHAHLDPHVSTHQGTEYPNLGFELTSWS